MKEYNEETHFLMPRKASTTFKWVKFLTQMFWAFAEGLGVSLLLLWALLQVVLMLKELIW